MLQEERDLETIPVGALGIIPLKGCEQLSQKVNDYLVDLENGNGRVSISLPSLLPDTREITYIIER